ncbi:MAG: NapC/NirT family cytochrome c [Mailhella sp.]|nr:NapC/NirT family cytochrome c [Mailhella sp.]
MKIFGRGMKTLLIGIVIGAGGIFAAAAAMTYSDSGPFCSMCHVMEEAAVTHMRSPHAAQVCNECHSPHSLLVKLPFKAQTGLYDIYANFMGHEPPLRASEPTRELISANCRSCHAVSNSEVMMAKQYCLDCHRGAAHNKKLPIAYREAADE